MTQQNLNNILGVDVGGTAIKLAAVNALTGEVTDYKCFDTPKNAMPSEIFPIIKEHVPKNCYAIGFGLPCIVKDNVLLTAPKDPRWIRLNFAKLAEDYFQVGCSALNDADAAAIAEIQFGVMKELTGVTIMITLGTGIGTAIYNNRSLMFNTEFGRMAMPGGINNAEDIASVSVKTRENLDWLQYAQRVNLYLNELNRLYWPDNIVIGGGVSDAWNEWSHLLTSYPFNLYKAKMGNKAGLIGAAYYAGF